MTLGIAGVGLIGGSIALRARGRGTPVIGCDPDPRAAGLVDALAPSVEALAEDASTLVLALPLDATLDAIARLRERARCDLVLDVASVKLPVVARARGWARFVPTHPIAGAEIGGPLAARADLFHDRAWAYVPGTGDESADAAARDFIEAMGARPVAVDAATHDGVLALTSHLPQVVVSTLAAFLAEAHLPVDLAGPGLASTLRLARSPWTVWEPIVRANAEPLAAALQALGGRLEGLAHDVRAGDVTRLASYFEDALAGYDSLVRLNGTETLSPTRPLS